MTTHTTHVQSDAYKWLVLTLAAFTFTFVVAIPQMSLPVLFDEISAELGLSLVQVGWIWGFGSVMGIANVFAPPVGNWLAKFGSGLPFLFWAALVFLGFVAYLFLRQPAIGSHSSSQAGS
jgi:hypothetical protein